MRYTEHAPTARLAPYVDRLWTLEGDSGDLGTADQPILPDGRSELIVHFGDPFERVDSEGSVTRQPDVVFAGQLTRPLVLRPTGRIAVLGVRFHPDGAATAIRESQQTLSGLTLGIEECGGHLARVLEEARDRATSIVDSVHTVQDGLSAVFDPGRVDARVRHVVREIQRRRGRINVDDLSNAVGLTRRHLERRFQQLVGVSPKQLARIARFQHARAVLEQLDFPGRGASTAALCGYADQSHFIREFRELAGCPPEAHLMCQAELTGFFADARA